MNNILVIGSTGQIGSELTRELRRIYGNDHVVAGYIKGAEPKGELLESGPSAEADVTNPQMIADVVKQYNIDTIYNLAALLSVVAESKPRLAWKIGIDGLWNILEVAKEAQLCCVYSKFNRFFRRIHSALDDSAGHCTAPTHNLWRFQGYYRIAERLFPQ